MTQQRPAPGATTRAPASGGGGSKIGKRYFCPVCNSEFVVTKAGLGTLTCHGQPLQMK